MKSPFEIVIAEAVAVDFRNLLSIMYDNNNIVLVYHDDVERLIRVWHLADRYNSEKCRKYIEGHINWLTQPASDLTWSAVEVLLEFANEHAVHSVVSTCRHFLHENQPWAVTNEQLRELSGRQLQQLMKIWQPLCDIECRSSSSITTGNEMYAKNDDDDVVVPKSLSSRDAEEDRLAVNRIVDLCDDDHADDDEEEAEEEEFVPPEYRTTDDYSTEGGFVTHDTQSPVPLPEAEDDLAYLDAVEFAILHDDDERTRKRRRNDSSSDDESSSVPPTKKLKTKYRKYR